MFGSLKTWHKVKQLEQRIESLEDSAEKLTGRLRARAMNASPCADEEPETIVAPKSNGADASATDRTAVREQLRAIAKQAGVRGVQ